MYSIFAADSKEEVDGYFTTGVTSSPRHLASIMRPFFLDVDRMPVASQVSIQFHMVSYCSTIKCLSYGHDPYVLTAALKPLFMKNRKLFTLFIHGTEAPLYMKKIYPAPYIPLYGSNTVCGG